MGKKWREIEVELNIGSLSVAAAAIIMLILWPKSTFLKAAIPEESFEEISDKFSTQQLYIISERDFERGNSTATQDIARQLWNISNNSTYVEDNVWRNQLRFKFNDCTNNTFPGSIERERVDFLYAIEGEEDLVLLQMRKTGEKPFDVVMNEEYYLCCSSIASDKQLKDPDFFCKVGRYYPRSGRVIVPVPATSSIDKKTLKPIVTVSENPIIPDSLKARLLEVVYYDYIQLPVYCEQNGIYPIVAHSKNLNGNDLTDLSYFTPETLESINKLLLSDNRSYLVCAYDKNIQGKGIKDKPNNFLERGVEFSILRIRVTSASALMHPGLYLPIGQGDIRLPEDKGRSKIFYGNK